MIMIDTGIGLSELGSREMVEVEVVRNHGFAGEERDWRVLSFSRAFAEVITVVPQHGRFGRLPAGWRIHYDHWFS